MLTGEAVSQTWMAAPPLDKGTALSLLPLGYLLSALNLALVFTLWPHLCHFVKGHLKVLQILSSVLLNVVCVAVHVVPAGGWMWAGKVLQSYNAAPCSVAVCGAPEKLHLPPILRHTSPCRDASCWPQSWVWAGGCSRGVAESGGHSSCCLPVLTAFRQDTLGAPCLLRV